MRASSKLEHRTGAFFLYACSEALVVTRYTLEGTLGRHHYFGAIFNIKMATKQRTINKDQRFLIISFFSCF